jgi:hypothetical protein
MKKEQLEKGSQLVLNDSTGLPKTSVNYVRFDNQNVGVGIYVEDDELPTYSIIKQSNGEKLILDDYNLNYDVKDWEIEELENNYKSKFSD